MVMGSAGRFWLGWLPVLLAAAAAFPQAGEAQKAARVPQAPQSGAVLTAKDATVLQQALSLYDAGKLDEAQVLLGPLAARYAGQAEVQAAEGSLLLEKGQLAEGAGYLERSLRLEPGNVALAENLGVAYLKLGRAADAVAVLEKACRRDSGNAEAKRALAAALLANKQYAQAAESYAAVMRQAGDTGDAAADTRYNWALALLGAGRPKEAVEVLRATPQLEARAASQELLGEAEEKAGEFTAAFAAFKQAAAVDASEANVFAYGNELLQHWNFAAATEIFRFGRERYPASARIAMGMGIAMFGNGDFAAAAAVFHRLLEAEPDNATIADLLGRSCSAGVPAAASCAGLAGFAKRHPKNARASLYAAIALLQEAGTEATYAEAGALLQAAVTADPKLAESWYETAVLQQTRGQWAESEASLERAIALRPAYAEAHYRLARAYSHAGKRAEAQREIVLEQEYATAAKDADRRRMQEVMTFLTTSN